MQYILEDNVIVSNFCLGPGDFFFVPVFLSSAASNANFFTWPSLAFPAWHVALSILAVSSCGRSYMSLLVQTFIFFDLGSPVQGRSCPVLSKPITLLKLCDHSPMKEPHLWQLDHHRSVKLTLSHTSPAKSPGSQIPAFHVIL